MLTFHVVQIVIRKFGKIFSTMEQNICQYLQHDEEKAMFGIKDDDYYPNDRYLRMLATTCPNDMFADNILCVLLSTNWRHAFPRVAEVIVDWSVMGRWYKVEVKIMRFWMFFSTRSCRFQGRLLTFGLALLTASYLCYWLNHMKIQTDIIIHVYSCAKK